MKLPSTKLSAAFVSIVLVMGTAADSSAANKDLLTRPAGPSADGKTGITPNNWQLTPAGEKLRVGLAAELGSVIGKNQRLTYGFDHYQDDFATSKSKFDLTTSASAEVAPGTPNGANYTAWGGLSPG